MGQIRESVQFGQSRMEAIHDEKLMEHKRQNKLYWLTENEANVSGLENTDTHLVI